jgi:hypothetical protein
MLKILPIFAQKICMASIYVNLQNERQYAASTGLTIAKFDELHEIFDSIYVPKPTNSITGNEAYLIDSREALFFILVYLKTYPTWQFLGLLFGFSDTTSGSYIAYILPSLKQSLKEKDMLVFRLFENQADFDKAFEGVTEIFIDGTEIPIERAENDIQQRKTFSGKKKAHTLIFLIVCDKKGRIIFMGHIHVGQNVDITLFKKELAIFNYERLQLWVDLGFEGIEKTLQNTCETDRNVIIGHKKKKKKTLTDAQKAENFEIARVRVKVEHAIGGLKRYYILRHENRLNNPAVNPILDLALDCCAGLWNFRRSFKKPQKECFNAIW